MRHLLKLAQGMNTIQAQHAIAQQAGLWDRDRIILREWTSKGNLANWFAFDMLPQLRPFIFGLMGMIEGEELGPVEVLRVAPGKVIEDQDRDSWSDYICVISAFPGVGIEIGAEAVMILSGEVYWVDKLPHRIVNNSQDDLLLLQIRATPNAPATYIPEVADADVSK